MIEYCDLFKDIDQLDHVTKLYITTFLIYKKSS